MGDGAPPVEPEAAGDHWRFYIVFASVVFYAIFNTAAPAYSARVIDELWGHMKVAFANNTTFSITWENCGRTIFIYFMIWTAAASFYALQSFLMSSVAERLNLRLRNRIAQKLNRLPLAYFDAHRPGEVVSRATNDLDKMSESMQRGLLQLLVSIGTVVGAVSVMFVFSVPLTLVFLFFTALSAAGDECRVAPHARCDGERQEWVSKITSAVEEGYSGRLVIRAFNRERQSSAEVHEASKELARVSTKADFMINAVGPRGALYRPFGADRDRAGGLQYAGCRAYDHRRVPGVLPVYLRGVRAHDAAVVYL